jgi:hypothetical protein
MHVCHSCDVPGCCRPSHLFLGTIADNNRDCEQKGRRPFGSAAPNAKLCEGSVIDIRRRSVSGESYRSIARYYHVTHKTVARIAQGLQWRRVSRTPGEVSEDDVLLALEGAQGECRLVGLRLWPSRTASESRFAAVGQLRRLRKRGLVRYLPSLTGCRYAPGIWDVTPEGEARIAILLGDYGNAIEFGGALAERRKKAEESA